MTADDPRRVTRRELPADCLLNGELHPSIKERLERIRQIPHPGVTPLLSVERDVDGRAYLVWERVEGRSFLEIAGQQELPVLEAATLMRELLLSVESFHAAGLVHGALIAENIIVAPNRSIRLTGASPLLYTDPAIDERAILELLCEVAARRGEASSPLGQLIGGEASLRELHMRLAEIIDAPDAAPSARIEPRADSRLRAGALIAAVVILLIGIGITAAILMSARRTIPKPMTPPVLHE
jgi:serine/threonine protein kinase